MGKTGPSFVIHGVEVEVSWSKPVDKQLYNQRKLLTKVYSQGYGNAATGGISGHLFGFPPQDVMAPRGGNPYLQPPGYGL